MKLVEKIKNEDRKNDALSMITQMERYFAALELKYHIYLFISGVCLLFVLGKLGWIASIGWFFFSKLVSMILAKLESMKVESDVMKMMNETPKFYFPNSLN